MTTSRTTFGTPVPPANSTADPAVLTAQDREDVVVGNRLVRFRAYTRTLHWSLALTFFICLFSGLPIWTPIFGWMAALFGGLQVCRWLHAWTGVAFAVLALLQFVHWAGQMRMGEADRRFIRLANFRAYMRWETHDEDVGKFNGGQKVLFWLSSLAAVGLLLTGVVLWFPNLFGRDVWNVSWLLHDITFILFVLLIFGHVYLTIAEPGTFTGMVKGTVTRTWARLHHPRWYRDVTGDRR